MLQPKKPVKKYVPTAKEKKNLDDASKNINMRPTGPSGPGRLKPTLGDGKNVAKAGKSIKKAKAGGSFPDLNKDGKITKADILKGRGVIAKKGATIKKAQMGSKVGNYAPTKENIDKGFSNKSIKSEDKDYKVKVKLKDDGSVKATERRTLKGFLTGAPKAGGKLMKSGGSMKKCKYGCK